MELKPSGKIILYILFAASGFSALVYEILWSKYLSLTFGNTMLAVSIVAATFMGGLALGSYLLGRHADHDRNLLRLYALLEAGIAFFALLFPPTIQIVTKIHTYLEHMLPAHPLFTHGVHFLFAAILLLPPTVCMGGTFPLMCRFFARKRSGGQIGRLYALNTLGATAGTLLAGFLLIPALGLSRTGYLAVGLNAGIAVVALLLARNIGDTRASDVSSNKRPEQPLQAKQHRLPLVGIGIVGFLALAYEILWTRVFLLFLGNTTYAFSLILGAFLIGIALGGAIYARKVHPELDERKVFVRLTMLMGLSVLLTVPFYDRLALVFQRAHEISGENWWLLSAISFAIVFAVIGLPTLISGSLLPATVAILDPGQGRTGEGVGLVVLYNTVGAVFGSILAGFVLIPWLGLQSSFALLAAINLLLAAVLALRLRPAGRRRLTLASLATGVLLLATLQNAWDQDLMNSGVYIYALKYAKMGGIQAVLAKEKVVETIEGRDTTVAVHESLDGVFRFFTVNGKTDGGNGRDMATQTMVGQLPMLLHPAPEDVLVIGLGTGITLRGMSAHPTERIDCVEISPEVVQAEKWFRTENGNALADPKIHLTINDGRDLLLTTERSYDVIVSEPSNPWQTGNANLFTADFYQLAAQCLKPGGLFCQWVGLYDITPENLKVVCNTFLQSFPRVMVFKAGSDLIIVGSREPLKFDYLSLRQRFAIPGIRSTLEAIDILSPGDLLASHYLYSEGPLADLAKGAAVNTDDTPILEYAARYNLGEKTLGAFQQENMSILLNVRGKVTLPLVNLGSNDAAIAAALRDLGAGYARAGRKAEAEYFDRTARQLEAAGDQSSPRFPSLKGG